MSLPDSYDRGLTLDNRTNTMMDLLIRDAINRGALTALSSGVTMVLVSHISRRRAPAHLVSPQFLALPDTFWFFLGLAPSSKRQSRLFIYILRLLTSPSLHEQHARHSQHAQAHPRETRHKRQGMELDSLGYCSDDQRSQEDSGPLIHRSSRFRNKLGRFLFNHGVAF